MSTIQYNNKGQYHGTCQLEEWSVLYDNGVPISATLVDGAVIKPNKNTEIELAIIIFRNDAGQKHRVDGPAVIWSYGYKAWWLNDVYYGDSEEPPEVYLESLKNL